MWCNYDQISFGTNGSNICNVKELMVYDAHDFVTLLKMSEKYNSSRSAIYKLRYTSQPH